MHNQPQHFVGSIISRFSCDLAMMLNELHDNHPAHDKTTLNRQYIEEHYQSCKPFQLNQLCDHCPIKFSLFLHCHSKQLNAVHPNHTIHETITINATIFIAYLLLSLGQLSHRNSITLEYFSLILLELRNESHNASMYCFQDCHQSILFPIISRVFRGSSL
jgi:hypothetical protein